MFEIKTSIWPIVDNIIHIQTVQAKFIEALKNVKIDDKYPYIQKEFKSILMCDHNPLEAKYEAQNSTIKKKNLIYSGFQIGITFVNRLNNNIRDLHKKLIV